MVKTGSVIVFFLEKWGLSYTWQSGKRGLFAPHIRTMSHIGSYPPLGYNFFLREVCTALYERTTTDGPHLIELFLDPHILTIITEA